ncbi:MAG: hypothetical protein IPL41_13465 [Micropruina sp.]|nr:hypothetical protein [Micropruina sp.]
MTWTAIPADEVCDLIEFWRDAPWPMTTTQTNERAAQLGWTVEDEDFLVNEVSGLSNTDVDTSTMPSGDLAGLTFGTTDVIGDPDAKAQGFLDDQFTLVVRAGTQRWGKPRMQRTKAGGQAAQWDLADDGARVIVLRTASGVLADFTTPQYARVLRGLGQ